MIEHRTVKDEIYSAFDPEVLILNIVNNCNQEEVLANLQGITFTEDHGGVFGNLVLCSVKHDKLNNFIGIYNKGGTGLIDPFTLTAVISTLKETIIISGIKLITQGYGTPNFDEEIAYTFLATKIERR